jgi:hypothetical protein
MLTKTCSAAGCGAPVAGRYSQLCAPHRLRRKVHGHPHQQTITMSVLGPHMRFVRSTINDQSNAAEINKLLHAIWKAMVAEASNYVGEFEAGRARVKWLLRANQELIKVAADVDADKVVEVVAGMVILQRQFPNTFQDDRAFWIQTARRFRALTTLTSITRWSDTEKREKRRYSDFPARAAEALGKMLVVELGEAGEHIRRLEAEKVARPLRRKAALRIALGVEAGASV